MTNTLSQIAYKLNYVEQPSDQNNFKNITG